ncbi:MAG: hypothetical protein QXI49_06740 [Candidatus Methanomethylicaceae archaeon]
MILGLKETYNINDEEIVKYLIEKEGIKGNFTEDVLIKIIKEVTLFNSK